jgi:RNA polymerase sigma factor (sigma-70 family)
MNPQPENPPRSPARELQLPESCLPLARRLFAESSAEQWQLSFKTFQSALARSAAKRFASGDFSPAQFEGYAITLHARDLALACACIEGSEHAWEEFVAQYRGYLRSASSAILRRPCGDAAVIELADSIFADLYGLTPSAAAKETPGLRSLFRYFHGRSSLKTWLRAVLAQRHIDAVRAGKKFDSLDDQSVDGEPRRVPEPAIIEIPPDPRREQHLRKFHQALASALAALDSRDRSRLHLYYAEGRTLAEIGKQIGEHESSVSRNLERVRKELRATVEGLLRAVSAPLNGGPAAPGLDAAQVALCIQYAAEDSGIDLDQLFDADQSRNTPPANPGVKP